MGESAKIKDIYLPLFDYKFDHGPSLIDHSNPLFVGRERILQRLELILDETRSRSKQGAYLIAGYRGMGKTSLVREAITKVNQRADRGKNGKKLEVFEFSLAQGEVHEMDLFRQMAWKLNRYVASLKLSPVSPCSRFFKEIFFPFLFLGISFLLALCIYHGRAVCAFFVNPFVKDSAGYVFLFFILVSVFFLFWVKILSLLLASQKVLKFIPSTDSLIEDILSLSQELQFRLHSSYSREDVPPTFVNLGGTNPATVMVNRVLGALSADKNQQKSALSFQKATPKEIEQYLFTLLKKLDELRKMREEEKPKKKKILPFVFVVDELDKIEPDYYYSSDRETEHYLYAASSSEEMDTKSRKRNDTILRLLANMKNFLTNAPAKFIFIGGRDVYDASLADIADRESFYSSIFNEVIYVPTFFKDKLSQNAGLTQLTEVFLCNLLWPTQKDSAESNGKNGRVLTLKNLLKKYQSECFFTDQGAEVKKLEAFKLLHTLQNLVVYLTFRSNGSPKKLIELLEGYIVSESFSLQKMEQSFSQKQEQPFVLGWPKRKTDLYLRLPYLDQYAINLHSNLYRPYVSINSRHLKSLGDKLLYSSAFLIDHILKFHKSAFSWRNLEQMPDIILANRDPNFRKFYSDVMHDFSQQHLRKTVNAVFQYKFNSKVSSELRYASRIADRSSAAFNFTLDESYHLKSYYRKKLAVKYREYKDLSLNKGDFEYIYTVGSLHSIIGDLHYYDEEYDDAILHYSDALQLLKSGSHSWRNSAVKAHEMLLFVRNTLNMGLCYEKAKMYDRAYSTYRSIILALKDFWERYQRDDDKQRYAQESIETSQWEEPYKRVQLFQRPHIALLHVIEKTRQDGITYDNLRRNFYEYLNFLDFYDKEARQLFPEGLFSFDYETLRRKEPLSDKKRIITLIADYYFSVGSMLFYKNSIYYGFLSADGTNKRNYKDPILDKIKEDLLDVRKPDSGGNGSKVETSGYHPSFTALLYYTHALKVFNAPYIENIHSLLDGIEMASEGEGKKAVLHEIDTKNSTLIDNVLFVTNYLSPHIYRILNADQFSFLGNILTKIGDSILASLPKDSTFMLFEGDELKLNKYVELFHYRDLDFNRREVIDAMKKDELSLELVFALYRMSYHCFKQAGQKFAAAFQYNKLLYTLREVIEKKEWDVDMCENGRDVIKASKAHNVLKKLDKLFEVPLLTQIDISMASVRSQLIKYRNATDWDLDFTPLLYNNLSSSPEVKEYVMLRETIRIKLGLPDVYSGLKNASSSKYYIGEYSTVSSIFTRVLELKFKGDQELAFLKSALGFRSVDDFLCEKNGVLVLKHRVREKNEELMRLLNACSKNKPGYRRSLVNAFFCFYESTRILRVYGIGYIINHGFMAALCERMGLISALYHYLQGMAEQVDEKLDKELDALLGKNVRVGIDPYEYFDLARLHYGMAREMHTEGKTYMQAIEDLYVLDDDFNDQLSHFCAAIERYRLNQGTIHEREKRIAKFLKCSGMPRVEKYV